MVGSRPSSRRRLAQKAALMMRSIVAASGISALIPASWTWRRKCSAMTVETEERSILSSYSPLSHSKEEASGDADDRAAVHPRVLRSAVGRDDGHGHVLRGARRRRGRP